MVVFRGPQGQISIPGSSHSKPPKGYVREEITTRKAADRLCKELNVRDSQKFWSNQQHEYEFYNKSLAGNRRDIERMMEDGSLHPKVKEFMAIAMREGDKSDRVKYEAANYFEVLE